MRKTAFHFLHKRSACDKYADADADADSDAEDDKDIDYWAFSTTGLLDADSYADTDAHGYSDDIGNGAGDDDSKCSRLMIWWPIVMENIPRMVN